MADTRAAILKAVLEADRLHQAFGTKSRAEKGQGRVDVFNMLLKRDIPLLFRPLSTLLGAYIDQPSPGVLVTTRRPLPIQRFTAAHELGHAILGHKPSLEFEEVLARSPFVDRASYDLQEIEANAFASELLMPKWLLATHMRQQEWQPKDLASAQTVYQLSLRLGTSYSATCHALYRHKAVSHKVYGDLLEVEPKTIKQSLVERYEPPNWYGDVWVVTEKDGGMLLEGSRADLVVVRVEEHSGSGFLWGLDELVPAGLAIVHDGRRSSPDQEVIGGTVHRVVIAKVAEPIRRMVRLREVRPWQRDGDALHSLNLEIDLSGPVSAGLLNAQKEVLLGAA